jgi:hypothetical protein
MLMGLFKHFSSISSSDSSPMVPNRVGLNMGEDCLRFTTISNFCDDSR